MAHFIDSAWKSKTGEPSKLLVDPEGNVYRFKRETKTTKVWNCSMKESRNCKAEVKTNLEVSVIFLFGVQISRLICTPS